MTEMERLAAAGQTAAQFAHEVGTPLNLISGHVQLLQTSVANDSKEANRLQTINTQIRTTSSRSSAKCSTARASARANIFP